LKKQSQFAGGDVGAKAYVKGYYGNKPACGVEENKANSKHVLSAVEWANFGWFGW